MGLVLETLILIDANIGKLDFSNFQRTFFTLESMYIFTMTVSKLLISLHLSKDIFKVLRITSIEATISSMSS